MKQPPLINRSLTGNEQSPDDGVIDTTTGARTPRSITHVEVNANGPKILLSPSVNVVVNVRLAKPPQHDSGNADPVNPV
jgi:hypothetical protein